MTKQDITPADSVVPVYLEEPTQAELDARQADAEALETQRQERATKLVSAITKLKALGLTEAEAKIIIGIE
jgi:hypothetical protein